LQHFIASDGARIAYRERGSGRPLVLLHGLMAHGGFFLRQDELSSDFRIVAVDLRGHGGSVSRGNLTIARLAEDIAELAERLRLEDAIGVGWSLGASILWRVLVSPAGRRFAGAVVVDMAPRVLNGEDWTLGLSSEMCEARTCAIRDDYTAFATNAGSAIFAQPVAEEHQPLAAWSGEEFARNDPASVATLWESLVREDARPLLGAIRQPTLVIHGAHSQLYGSGTAEHLVAALPDARAIGFERSGHAPHLEEPHLFNRLIREFAADLPQLRQTQATA
jgi:pimeloyl-ACP methyl ester carboxylesterase